MTDAEIEALCIEAGLMTRYERGGTVLVFAEDLSRPEMVEGVRKVLELRAQADARPVAWMDDGSTRNGSESTSYRVVTDATKRNMPSAAAQAYTTPLYTHPEASAPGLSDDEIKAGAHRLWLLEGQGLSKLEHYEAELRTILTRASAATVAEPTHPDDEAVDRFAAAMKQKLAQAREKGRGGWQQCDPVELSIMLREHVEKGDPRDVANFCMFLWNLGKPISDAALPYGKRAAQQQAEPGADERAALEAELEEWKTYAKTMEDNAAELVDQLRVQSGQRAGVAEKLLVSLCQWLLHRFGPNTPEGEEAQSRLRLIAAAPTQQQEGN